MPPWSPSHLGASTVCSSSVLTTNVPPNHPPTPTATLPSLDIRHSASVPYQSHSIASEAPLTFSSDIQTPRDITPPTIGPRKLPSTPESQSQTLNPQNTIGSSMPQENRQILAPSTTGFPYENKSNPLVSQLLLVEQNSQGNRICSQLGCCRKVLNQTSFCK